MLEQLQDDYFRALNRKGYSPNTLSAYSWAIADFIKFHGDDPLTRQGVEAWQDSLANRGIAATSRQTASSSVRAWLRWCAVNDRPVPPNLWMTVESVKVGQALPRPIPERDLERILAYFLPVRPRMAVVDLRNRALFYYLLGTGARVSEALQVQREDVEHYPVIRQKGGSQKVLYAPAEAVEAVNLYLAARKDNHHALWVTHDHNRPLRRLDSSAVREIWKTVARRAGVSPFTTHQVRHTCATLLVERGHSVQEAAEHMGHHGLATIMRYVKVSEQRRKAAAATMGEVMRPPAGEWDRPRLLPPLTRRRRHA
jgi:site-specific recombinase XerD